MEFNFSNIAFAASIQTFRVRQVSTLSDASGFSVLTYDFTAFKKNSVINFF